MKSNLSQTIYVLINSCDLWPFRSNATDEELGEITKTNNPEEINIDDDEFDTDEEKTVEGKQNPAVTRCLKTV